MKQLQSTIVTENSYFNQDITQIDSRSNNSSSDAELIGFFFGNSSLLGRRSVEKDRRVGEAVSILNNCNLTLLGRSSINPEYYDR